MLDIVLHGLLDLVAGYGPRSPKSFDGLRHCHRFAIAILPVHGLRGSMLLMPLVEHHVAAELRIVWCVLGDVAAAGRCAEWWRFSAEELVSARRSVLVDSELPPLRVARKRVFSQCFWR